MGPPVTNMTVAARIAGICVERGDAPAVIGFDEGGGEQVATWRRLTKEVQEIGRRLRADPKLANAPAVIAVEARNTPSALIQILGVLAAEFPLLPLDPRAPQAERARLLSFVSREYGPICLLTEDDMVWATEPTMSPASGDSSGSRRRIAYFLATGGSSGLTKVVAAPGPLRYDASRTPSPLSLKACWRNGQRQLVAGPLHHSAPFNHCIHGILDENTIILQPLFTPDRMLELLCEYSIEWLQLTPANMRSVVQLTEPDAASFANMRAMLHTAAPCDFSTKKAWLDLVGPTRVFECYASTEGIGVTLVRGDEWLARPGTVGKGFLTQIRILDDAGRVLPTGEIGAVYLRSGRMSGQTAYLGGLTIATTPDGFASVGDHGWLDEAGYLFLAPRRTNLINVGGEKVYPAEVEAAILEHRSVLDVVVAGQPDSLFGEAVHAWVVLKDGERVRATGLIQHCAARLSPYKVPQRISIVAKVPRSAAGKIERWHVNEPQGE